MNKNIPFIYSLPDPPFTVSNYQIGLVRVKKGEIAFPPKKCDYFDDKLKQFENSDFIEIEHSENNILVLRMKVFHLKRIFIDGEKEIGSEWETFIKGISEAKIISIAKNDLKKTRYSSMELKQVGALCNEDSKYFKYGYIEVDFPIYYLNKQLISNNFSLLQVDNKIQKKDFSYDKENHFDVTLFISSYKK